MMPLCKHFLFLPRERTRARTASARLYHQHSHWYVSKDDFSSPPKVLHFSSKVPFLHSLSLFLFLLLPWDVPRSSDRWKFAKIRERKALRPNKGGPPSSLWGELLKSSCSLDSAEGTEGKGERRLRENRKGKRGEERGRGERSAGVPFIRGKKGRDRPERFFVRCFSFFTPFLLNPDVKEYLRIGGNLFLADSEFDTEEKKISEKLHFSHRFLKT